MKLNISLRVMLQAGTCLFELIGGQAGGPSSRRSFDLFGLLLTLLWAINISLLSLFLLALGILDMFLTRRRRVRLMRVMDHDARHFTIVDRD